MKGKSKYSEAIHLCFLDRFKGKLSVVDKTGQLGIVSSASKPIEKSDKTYEEIYNPKQSASYATGNIIVLL